MSFCLNPKRPMHTEVIRLMIAEIDAAVDNLTDTTTDQEKAIHNARRHCKRIRAVLRLIRIHQPDNYRFENRWFRDASRKLAPCRDAVAMQECFEELLERDDLEDKAFAGIRQGLEAYRKQMTAEYGSDADAVQDVLDGFAEARQRLADWTLPPTDFAVVGAGLKRIYRQARERMKQARKSTSTTDLHDWRKSVKYLWNQTIVLRHIVPRFKKSYRRRLHKLSSLLGDDHDLAVLHQFILENPEWFENTQDLEPFFDLLQQARNKLQQRAFTLGRKLLADKPHLYLNKIMNKS